MMLRGAVIFRWIFWFAVIVGVIWLVALVSGPSYRANRSDGRPMEILKERFAKGEINREQYEEGRRTLMNAWRRLSSALEQHTASGREKSKMFNTKNLGFVLAALALAIGVSFVPGLARQKAEPQQQGARAQQPMMSMSEMMQQMNQLTAEISWMDHPFHGGSQGMGMHGTMMSGNGMMGMSPSLNPMSGAMKSMMSGLNGMMSNRQTMRNGQI